MAKLQHLSNIQISKSGIYYLRCQRGGINRKISLHTRDYQLAKLAKLRHDAILLGMKIEKDNIKQWILRSSPNGDISIETTGEKDDMASATQIAESIVRMRAQREYAATPPAVLESIDRVASLLVEQQSQAQNHKKIKLAIAVADYIKKELAVGEKASKSISMAISVLNKMTKLAGDVDCDFINDIWLEDFWLINRLKTVSQSTAKRDLSFVRAFGAWAAHRKQNYIPIAFKFAVASSAVKKNHYDYLLADDLKKIFDELPSFANAASEFWIPVIGLYTGARIGEIAGMQTEEIYRVDSIETYFLAGTKTDDSPRRLPIHQNLIDIGFLDYVALRKKKKKKMLFDLRVANENGIGASSSKFFTSLMKKIGLFGGMKKFHSFRHTVVDLLNQAGCTDRAGAEYTGHSTGGDIRATVYGRKKLSMANLKIETVDKMDYLAYCGWQLDFDLYAKTAKNFI